MTILKKSFYFLFTILLAVSSLEAKEAFIIENQPAALEKALSLPQTGILKKKANGLVYLDVSNEFISLADTIDLPGRLQLTSIAHNAIGAHIPVFLPAENIAPEELGVEFPFNVKEIRSSIVKTKDGISKPWEISIDSNALKDLRQKYGCTPDLFYL